MKPVGAVVSGIIMFDHMCGLIQEIEEIGHTRVINVFSTCLYTEDVRVQTPFSKNVSSAISTLPSAVARLFVEG